MPMNKYLFIILLFFSAFSVSANSVIEGNNREYAGKTIHFYCWSDAVTQKEEPLFSIRFDNEGRFRSEVQVSKTTFAFCDFGIYRGMFFIEPNQKVVLLFPPLREKSFADEKNPFFEPVSFWFNLSNDRGINQQISSFDTRFNQLTNQYFNQLYFRHSKAVFDTVTTILNTAFPASNNPGFEIHKKLKLKSLEADAFRLKAEDIAGIFTEVKAEYQTHPAFIHFFDKVFANRLSFDVKDIHGDELRKAVAAGNTGALLKHVETRYKLKNETAALALLKMLHDAYYSGEFAKTSVLQALRSPVFASHNSPEIRKISANIIDKLTFLQPGSPAPVICLNDTNGNKKCSNETTDKFKYIVFADDEMMVCREHLKYLTTIQEKFEKHLEIILVMRKTNLIEMKIFLDKNQVPGIHLVDDKGMVIRQFRIKSYPTCFLLNEKHHVVFENTKAPLDGFEQQFGNYLRNELFERQREK